MRMKGSILEDLAYLPLLLVLVPIYIVSNVATSFLALFGIGPGAKRTAGGSDDQTDPYSFLH